MPATQAASEMRSWFNSYRVAVLQRFVADDTAEIAYTEGEIKSRLKYYRISESTYEGLIADQTERGLYEKSHALFDEYLKLSEQMLGLIVENRKPEALALMKGKMRDKKNEFIASIEELVNFNVEGGQKSARESALLLESSRTKPF